MIEELERRSKLNPRYSLRAFAKSLNITPGGLSLILSGRRNLTKNTASRIADCLGLSPTIREIFLKNVNRGKLKTEPHDSNDYYQKISADKYTVIADWHHYAILSLIETKDFEPNLNWIASRLGITTGETKAAIERLKSLGVLDVSSKKWKQIGGPIKVENSSALSAAKKHQRQVLNKAIQSLEEDPFEIRDMASMTIAIDPNLVPTAKGHIRKFRRFLMELLESKGNQKEVYHLAIQLYPVSKRNK